MPLAVVCVASNVSEGFSKLESFMARVREEIDSEAQFSSIYSTLSTTDGVTLYHNMLGRFTTTLSANKLAELMKQWEQQSGRKPHAREVALDIDVVIFDGIILRPRDFAQEYFQIGYRALDQGLSRSEM